MKLIKTLWWIFLLMPSGCLFAQPAPTIVSTLQTTNTGATSVSVGCAVGSSTCTGGISFGTAAGTSISLSGGYLEIQPNVPVSQTYRLVNNAGTLQWNGIALASGSSLSGTTNTIPLFTASNAVGNSIMTQSGTTITVATTLTATTLNGLLGTANQTGLTGVGTITSGVWNSTKIGLAYGGTNSDLSGTGGTSQFLRQNSVGAAVTVVRPATTDLSDGSNVALLNAVNVFTGAGTTQISTAAGNTSNALNVRNTSAGTAANAFLSVGTDVTQDQTFLQSYSSTYTPSGYQQASGSALVGNAAGGLSVGALNASTGVLRFFTGGNNIRWGINAAGDFTVGSSANIADSGGTPTIASGFGSGATITGNDYAFVVFNGTTNSTGGTINFGHTWTHNPVCMMNSNVIPSASTLSIGAVSTTQLSMAQTSSSNYSVYVLCRGY